MKPRIIPLEELTVELAGEHDAVCYELTKAEINLENFNYDNVEGDFRKVVKMLSQHTIDEQRSLLGYLIEKLGRNGSAHYIQVMRGHTQIVNIVNALDRSIADGKGISTSDIENLKTLLKEQFVDEQALFRQASSLMISESIEENKGEVDRYVNEGGK